MTTTKTQLSPAAVREWLNKNAEDLPWTMLGICEGIGAAPGSERAQVHDAVRYCVIAGFLTRTDTRMGPVFQRTGEGMRRVVLTDKQRKERKRAADAKRVGTTSPGAPRPPQATQACAARVAVRAANTPAKAVVMPRERTETVEQFHARGAGADSADGEGSWGGITVRALELVLPWPSKDLSPNARVHWRHRSKATKAARQMAVFLAFEAGWKSARLSPGRLHLWIDFYQAPRKVLPDDDNLLLRFKAYRYGIAQVLGIDDKRFISHPFVSNERRAGGQVVVRITGGPAAALKLNGGQGNAG